VSSSNTAGVGEQERRLGAETREELGLEHCLGETRQSWGLH
jgi:hypothetical protein